MKRLTVLAWLLAFTFLMGCGGAEAPPPDVIVDLSEINDKLEKIEKELDALKPQPTMAQPLEDPDQPKPIEGVLNRPTVPVEGIPSGIGGIANNLIDVNPNTWESVIVFTSSREPKGIYIMWEDGANPTLVYSQAGIPPGSPALSPDGRFIAFHAVSADPDRNGDRDIFVIRVNGRGKIQLTDGTRNGHFSSNLNPSWPPDGTKIAFTKGADILFVDADGENMVRVTHDSNSNDNPDWSPDGQWIAFSTVMDGNRNIHTIKVDGTRRTRLTNHHKPDDQPSWSPDGTEIVFMSYLPREGVPGGVGGGPFSLSMLLRLLKPMSLMA